MITIILSAIILGASGWLTIYTCFSVYHFCGYVPTITDYSFVVFGGSFIGSMIGIMLSACLLSKFVALNYPVSPTDKKYTLYPISSDWQTHLVKDDNGNITYCGPGQRVETARKDEVERVEVRGSEPPYFIYSYPRRNSFWGLFATFITLKPHLIFFLPRETMIKKGRVDIIKTTTHRTYLEPD